MFHVGPCDLVYRLFAVISHITWIAGRPKWASDRLGCDRLLLNYLYSGISLFLDLGPQSGRKKTREPKEENVTLGPAVREGEQVFGVAHIFASFNDTFIVSSGHVTDLSGRETLVRITGLYSKPY
ncbi:hypothetical protein BHE74_00034515 [Ensete ventricosum]|nr:hypothetical protein BHE74_00034515 [Ensete ventricosum]